MTPINVFWCVSPNVGDALSPWLAARISGRRPVYVDPSVGLGKFMVGGSMLNHATKDCVVWGSGLASMNDQVDAAAEIKAVRGPLSRIRALMCGATVPEVYGDPALVLPRFYTPTGEKTHELGIVAHFKQQHFTLSTLEGHVHETIRVIDVLAPVEEVIEAICSCRFIAASALHGLIIAGAYGIPATWIDLETPIGGDGMKFYDYALSVGVGDLKMSRVRPTMDALADPAPLLALPYFVPQVDLVPRLMAACPFKPQGRQP
jgi:pyruvyltransferase